MSVTFYIWECPICGEAEAVNERADKWPHRLSRHMQVAHDWATEYYAEEMKEYNDATR